MRKKSSHEETKLAQAPSEATIPAKSSENWMHALLGVFTRRREDISRDPARVSRAQLAAGYPSYIEHEAVKSVGRRLRALKLDRHDFRR
ncbi:MAG: hypothetical protein ACFB0F_14470 [Neomegalonema sp.]